MASRADGVVPIALTAVRITCIDRQRRTADRDRMGRAGGVGNCVRISLIVAPLAGCTCVAVGGNRVMPTVDADSKRLSMLPASAKVISGSHRP
jgi:hypothetical protein